MQAGPARPGTASCAATAGWAALQPQAPEASAAGGLACTGRFHAHERVQDLGHSGVPAAAEGFGGRQLWVRVRQGPGRAAGGPVHRQRPHPGAGQHQVRAAGTAGPAAGIARAPLARAGLLFAPTRTRPWPASSCLGQPGAALAPDAHLPARLLPTAAGCCGTTTPLSCPPSCPPSCQRSTRASRKPPMASLWPLPA